MFSVIIPTIWSPKTQRIDHLIETVASHNLVGEVILINNAPNKYSERYVHLPKVREYLQSENLFVNASWNMAVELSNFEHLCIVSDDIHFNNSVFDFVNSQLQRPDVKLIGMAKSCYTLESDLQFSLEPIQVRNAGWGCMVFLSKSNWQPIPSDLKIYFGDDYLIKHLTGGVHRLHGLKIEATFGTSHVKNPVLEQVVAEDTKNSVKYNLPWSNDQL
jgi:hypothetical protein